MPWLVRGAEVLASLEVADTFSGRLRGLLGRDGLEGAMLIRPARSVHTIGMRFPLDVAFCDDELRVVDTVSMPPWRIGRPRRRASCVIEAQAGAFARWELAPGDHLAITNGGTTP